MYAAGIFMVGDIQRKEWKEQYWILLEYFFCRSLMNADDDMTTECVLLSRTSTYPGP
jgi:hypothetical protein